jgi:hypothetical protein
MCNLPPEVRAALYGTHQETDVPADDPSENSAEELDLAWQTV